MRMEANVAGFLWGWKQTLQYSSGDGIILCGIPTRMYFYLTCMMHLQQQKFVFKLPKNVCTDSTDAGCILSSAKWFASNVLSHYNRVHNLSLLLYKWGWNGDRNNFGGDGWGWNGSSEGMDGHGSETVQRWVRMKIMSVEMGGDGCNFVACIPLVVAWYHEWHLVIEIICSCVPLYAVFAIVSVNLPHCESVMFNTKHSCCHSVYLWLICTNINVSIWHVNLSQQLLLHWSGFHIPCPSVFTFYLYIAHLLVIFIICALFSWQTALMLCEQFFHVSFWLS